MLEWIVEPPNDLIRDRSSRVIEVDENGTFVRVIAKLNEQFDADHIAAIASTRELYAFFSNVMSCISNVRGNTSPPVTYEEETLERIIDLCDDMLRKLQRRRDNVRKLIET